MKKILKIALQMDPLENLDLRGDTTFIIGLEAIRRGFEVFFYSPSDLIYKNNFVYANTKMLENQKAQLRDLEQSLDDFENTGGKKEWFNQVGVNNPELEKEKWEMGEEQFEKTISEARDFIKEKREIVEKAEQQIQGAN